MIGCASIGSGCWSSCARWWPRRRPARRSRSPPRNARAAGVGGAGRAGRTRCRRAGRAGAAGLTVAGPPLCGVVPDPDQRTARHLPRRCRPVGWVSGRRCSWPARAPGSPVSTAPRSTPRSPRSCRGGGTGGSRGRCRTAPTAWTRPATSTASAAPTPPAASGCARRRTPWPASAACCPVTQGVAVLRRAAPGRRSAGRYRGRAHPGSDHGRHPGRTPHRTNPRQRRPGRGQPGHDRPEPARRRHANRPSVLGYGPIPAPLARHLALHPNNHGRATSDGEGGAAPRWLRRLFTAPGQRPVDRHGKHRAAASPPPSGTSSPYATSTAAPPTATPPSATPTTSKPPTTAAPPA